MLSRSLSRAGNLRVSNIFKTESVVVSMGLEIGREDFQESDDFRKMLLSLISLRPSQSQTLKLTATFMCHCEVSLAYVAIAQLVSLEICNAMGNIWCRANKFRGNT